MGKIYEVEKENVGVESGHRIELGGEKAGGDDDAGSKTRHTQP